MSNTSKRKDTRYDFPSTIEYVMGLQVDDAVVHKGVAINVSSTGVGMYVFEHLPKGQQITIKTSLPVNLRTGAICWTMKEDVNLYRTGMKFI